jgi:hypothetical protein
VTKEDRKIWILICAAIVVLLIVVLLVRHGPWRVATSVPSAQDSIELQPLALNGGSLQCTNRAAIGYEPDASRASPIRRECRLTAAPNSWTMPALSLKT